MRGFFGMISALLYAAAMGILLYLNIPRALLLADARAASLPWAVPASLLALLLVAVLVSQPLRGLLHWSGKTCGKFYAICCATLLGALLTYELFHYMSAGLFSGQIAGGLYVLFGGICMMACPIVAIYKYVS